jgi:DNA-binding transcriptional regulator YiaG
MAVRNPCDDIRATRKKTGLIQSAFWSSFAVTQAAGSRYESGRSIPIPTQMLIEIAYGTRGDQVIRELRSHVV